MRDFAADVKGGECPARLRACQVAFRSGAVATLDLALCRSAGSGSLSSLELLEAMSGNLTDQVTVLKPLEVAHHDALWRAAVW